jgi:soluble cytochrome b562
MTNFSLIVTLGLFSVAAFSSTRADTALDRTMQRMARPYKQLALDLKQPSEANKTIYLELAEMMKTQAKVARAQVPSKAAALPPDQQATMVAAYQKSMDDLIATIDGLTADLQSSQWDAANQQIAKLKQQMIDGHKAFRTQKPMAAPPTASPVAPAPTAPAPESAPSATNAPPPATGM